MGNNCFHGPAGRTISDAGQDAIGLLGHLSTLLARVQPAVNQHLQVLFCWATFQPLFPRPIRLHGVVTSQVQCLAFNLVECCVIGFGLLIQPIQISIYIPMISGFCFISYFSLHRFKL